MRDINPDLRSKLQKYLADPEAAVCNDFLLNQLFTECIRRGEHIEEVVRAVYVVLGEVHAVRLSHRMRRFIREIQVRVIWFYRASWSGADLRWLKHHCQSHLTECHACLALSVLPLHLREPNVVSNLLESLSGSDYWEDAVNELQDEIPDPVTAQLVQRWLNRCENIECRKAIESLIEKGKKGLS